MATKVTLNPNGPIKIDGDFELLDSSGKAFGLGERKTVFLCRCGATRNSPFCDGSHKACEFVAPSEARDV